MSKIYVFGNSHVYVFSRNKPGPEEHTISPDGRYICRSIGPTIAYNFFEHHYPKVIELLESEREFNKERDYVLLVVGEVDCRLHLVNQIKSQAPRPEEDIIRECVDRFFRCHLDLKARGYRVIGWGGHPSTIPEGRWVIGPYDKRLFIGRYFEQYMKRKCEENGILFKTMFDRILLPNGQTNMDLYLDDCHLKPDKTMHMINETFADLLQ